MHRCPVQTKPGTTVVETRSFVTRAKEVLSADERQRLIGEIARVPDAGTILAGTGGVRKLRFGTRGRGKSGSVRVIYYYHDASMPIFLLTVFAKNEKANLSQAERNAIKKLVIELVAAYGAEHE